MYRDYTPAVVDEHHYTPSMDYSDWVSITAAWLRDHNVERVFMAFHNFPVQFAEKSQFYDNCLRASVKYVVRISTTASAVRQDSIAYYQRAH